jgi:hypothetical protein
MRIRTKHNSTDAKEPLGIVIADGGSGDAAPRFSAFVWGPVPEELDALSDALTDALALQDQLATAVA